MSLSWWLVNNLYGWALTCLTTICACDILYLQVWLLLLMTWRCFILLHTVCRLVDVILFWSYRSSNCNTGFTFTNSTFTINFLCWFSVHWVCLSFTWWNDICISRLDLFFFVDQLNCMYLVLIDLHLLFLILGYQII